MTATTPSRRRRLLALATAAALGVGLIGALAPASPVAAAPGTGTGTNGQTLTVSDVDDLDPDGATITVTGSGYNASAGFDVATEGLYVALCVDKGAGEAPSPCVGGLDMEGEGGSSKWVTNNAYAGAPSVPISAGGSFETTLTVEASDAYVDCNDLPAGQSCKVVTRVDHRGSADRSQDVKVPVTFGEPEPGARLEVSPANGLFDGPQDVAVSGVGYPTTGPGFYVVFGPEPVNTTDPSVYGAAAFVQPADIGSDGSFSVTLEGVDPTYSAGGQPYDFRDGGGHISTFRAHGNPDPNGDWLRSKPVTFRARTAVESFVTAAHVDFLGEEPNRTELATDVAKLNQGQTKATYLKALSTSDAWLEGVVDKLYVDTLGRPGDAGGVAFWLNRLRTGWSVARVAASFYSSPEYYNGIGGGTDRSWVTDLYQKILLRDAANDTGGRDYWVREVRAKGRGNVALRIYQSPESAGTRVKGLYDELLGRAPERDGLQYWAGVVVKRGDLTLAVQLANAGEYTSRAGIRFP